jgi:hypothetical protein
MSWSQHLYGGHIIHEIPYIADQFLAGGVNEIIANKFLLSD